MGGHLYAFDVPYRSEGSFLAGVDEAGCGPLAGPVVAAAVILRHRPRIVGLNDSKQLSALQREQLHVWIQRHAWSVSVGIVSAEDIDHLNIRQAGFAAMRLALAGLHFQPSHVLVDGFSIPQLRWPQTRVIEGDAKSASIAAASIIAKVTRDSLMTHQHRVYPGYGFDQHKGYATASHLKQLRALGPCAIHRRSFAPVRDALLRV